MNPELELRGATRNIAAAAREASAPPDEMALERALGRVRAQVEKQRAAGSRRAAAWGVSLGAAAILLVVAWRTLTGGRPPEALTYRVAGAGMLQPGYVRAQHEEHPKLSFSDGSLVALASDARLRIVTVDERGARLAIEEGEVQADIMHLAGARWTFEAGPYSVDVRGTSFSLAWRGADGWLDLRLHNGLLDVHIPWSQAPLSIHGGQRLTVKAIGHEVTITDLADVPLPVAAADAPAGAVSGPAPTAAAGPPLVASASPGASRKEHPPSWSERMASGALQSIVADALEHGVEATVRERSSEDLEVLEAAARYQKRPDIARKALLAQRTRFAGSSRAKEAAFLLGRLAESGDGVAAHEWYERYLSEAPDGAFAAEATGRNMVVSERIFGVERARPLAEAYLRRWPTGSHAKLAHSILDGQ